MKKEIEKPEDANRVKSIQQLMNLPIGSEVHKVENNDVRRYVIACHYPDKSNTIKSVLLTYGTSDYANKWISQITIGKLYLDRRSAVQRLISDMESDLEAVKRLYI
ncbi:hypothetical protein SAMN05421821_105142 [Mucilaginibacter lappiensis]|uniref:Uncharacterized protein n=1 Tax=Mucilaginibacter lappiensis TaxID=354630 RepID=A0ABR6PL41_9SPHI|nr:hypothetical protein [Mucilaginibacter lappiensis]MBB6109725.1 hypothetical protein [Mucilaginibacter lappiensis]SIR13231.1 hypothetical protein SAMN05421821_105142 [Mucilaginibacter lappiensis]